MALWSVISFLFVTNFVISVVTVSGCSMAPTLKAGDQYFLNRWTALLFAPGYGDLVVLRDRCHRDLAVKRVIAMPNDQIQFRNGDVYLNGRRLREPYLEPNAHTHPQKIGERTLQLGPDEYFVMGDNRLVSEDSRWHGPVRRADLLGTLTTLR